MRATLIAWGATREEARHGRPGMVEETSGGG
ncbi:hypothetical protein CDO43_33250, partial [Pseudomonas aeruginosa]